MSTRLRIYLAVAGLLLAVASLLALAYAFWPSDSATDEYLPPPTYFAPPESRSPAPVNPAPSAAASPSRRAAVVPPAGADPMWRFLRHGGVALGHSLT